MKTPRIKLSHEVPLAVLPVSKTFNDYDYCLPHLLDKEYDYFAYFEENFINCYSTTCSNIKSFSKTFRILQESPLNLKPEDIK